MLRQIGTAIALTLALAASAKAKEPSFVDWPPQVEWAPQFTGVELADLTLTQPRPLRVFALRIDLDAPGLSLITDNDNGDRPEEVDGLKTSTFLVKSRCQAAINASPFWPGLKEEGGPQNVVGLVVSEGRLVSPVDADKPRAAFVVTRSRRAELRHPPVAIDDVVTAVGGFGVVLEAGTVVRPEDEGPNLVDVLHPRTAIGIGAAGRTLYLVVVDGRQKSVSEGVSLFELGELLQKLGATDGVNLDGGGTSTMALSDGAEGFRLVNSPIDGGVPGAERISASHLGVWAKPLTPPQSPQHSRPAQSP